MEVFSLIWYNNMYLQRSLPESSLSLHRIKSNQIKSLLLSHHHSTSALVSEILMSVLQTVQKKKKKNPNNLHMDSTYEYVHIWRALFQNAINPF